MDRSVGEIQGGDAAAGFVALAAHGFTERREEICLNAWLCREGYLSFTAAAPDSFERIATGSKALALDPTRIYIHRKDRFPRGSVDPRDARRLCEEIRAKALGVEFEGEKVFQAAHFGEELYSGPAAASAPDLVLVANDGYDCKGWLRTGEPFGRSHFTGMHTWDDAFLWTPETMPDRFDITDVAGVIEGCLLDGDGQRDRT